MIIKENALFFAGCGGLLLGLACTLNYTIRGKQTGMTRIAYNIATLKKQSLPQTLAMLGGMWTISSIVYLFFGNGSYNGFQPFGPQKQIVYWTTNIGYIVAGLLTGFGAKLAGGCTSGHGLSGLPRLSLRSFTAVLMFLIGGISISTYASKYGLYPLVDNRYPEQFIHFDHHRTSSVVLVLGVILGILGYVISKKDNKKLGLGEHLLIYIIGGLFALGLLISGMSRRTNVLHFLQITQNWNPSLLLVLGFGVGLNTLSFAIMRKKGTSLTGTTLFNPGTKDQVIDWKVLAGGLCFGLGWGLAGICPGPFYVLFAVTTFSVQILWGLAFVVGSVIGGKVGDGRNMVKVKIG